MLERFIPHTEKAPLARLADSVIVFGNIDVVAGNRDPSLNQNARNSSLAAQILANANLITNVIAIGSPIEIGLVGDYFEAIGAEKPIIPKERTPDVAKQIKQIIKGGEFGDVAIITAEGSERELLEKLGEEGIHTQTISPDEEIGRRIASAPSNLGPLKQAFMDVLRFRNIKNVRLATLSLAKAG